jgi:ribonuclease HI
MMDIGFKKIKAHSGHALNNKADKLAREAASTKE